MSPAGARSIARPPGPPVTARVEPPVAPFPEGDPAREWRRRDAAMVPGRGRPYEPTRRCGWMAWPAACPGRGDTSRESPCGRGPPPTGMRRPLPARDGAPPEGDPARNGGAVMQPWVPGGVAPTNRRDVDGLPGPRHVRVGATHPGNHPADADHPLPGCVALCPRVMARRRRATRPGNGGAVMQPWFPGGVAPTNRRDVDGGRKRAARATAPF